MTSETPIPVIDIDQVAKYLKYKGASSLDTYTIDRIARLGKISGEEHANLQNIAGATSDNRLYRMLKVGIIKTVYPEFKWSHRKQKFELNMPVEDMILPPGAVMPRRKRRKPAEKAPEPGKTRDPPGVWYLHG